MNWQPNQGSSMAYHNPAKIQHSRLLGSALCLHLVRYKNRFDEHIIWVDFDQASWLSIIRSLDRSMHYRPLPQHLGLILGGCGKTFMMNPWATQRWAGIMYLKSYLAERWLTTEWVRILVLYIILSRPGLMTSSDTDLTELFRCTSFVHLCSDRNTQMRTCSSYFEEGIEEGYMIPVDVVPRVSAGLLVIGIWIGQSWPRQDDVTTILLLLYITPKQGSRSRVALLVYIRDRVSYPIPYNLVYSRAYRFQKFGTSLYIKEAQPELRCESLTHLPWFRAWAGLDPDPLTLAECTSVPCEFE